MVLTFESVNKFLKCDHSNEIVGYWQYRPLALQVLQYTMVTYEISLSPNIKG